MHSVQDITGHSSFGGLTLWTARCTCGWAVADTTESGAGSSLNDHITDSEGRDIHKKEQMHAATEEIAAEMHGMMVAYQKFGFSGDQSFELVKMWYSTMLAASGTQTLITDFENLLRGLRGE